MYATASTQDKPVGSTTSMLALGIREPFSWSSLTQARVQELEARILAETPQILGPKAPTYTLRSTVRNPRRQSRLRKPSCRLAQVSRGRIYQGNEIQRNSDSVDHPVPTNATMARVDEFNSRSSSERSRSLQSSNSSILETPQSYEELTRKIPMPSSPIENPQPRAESKSQQRELLQPHSRLKPSPRRLSRNPFASLRLPVTVMPDRCLTPQSTASRCSGQFSDFPLQIQQQIWKNTLLGARIVELCRGSTGYKTYHQLSQAFGICRISRAVALSSFKWLSYKQQYSISPFSPGAYLNLDIDTLVISQSDRWFYAIQYDLHSCFQLAKIRCLAIEVITWIDMMEVSSKQLLATLKKMKCLDRLAIVWTGTEIPYSFEDSVIIDEWYVVKGMEKDYRHQQDWESIRSRMRFGILTRISDARTEGAASIQYGNLTAQYFDLRRRQDRSWRKSTNPAVRNKDRPRFQV